MESLAHGPTLTGEAPPAERLAPGATAGDYVIERFLGAGAMGDVYAARHPVIHKRVAIKVLKRDLASAPEAAERFVREAQAVNQIDHENVVDIFGFGRLPDGRHYLAMALIDGVSLRARLTEPLAIADALDILDAVAAALDAAHARGVVHRDLKPDNVMLGAGNKVSVLDFGIAKLVASAEGTEGAHAMTLTGQGAWLGTPAYMAPEQWSADGAGPASDRYALGVMAFELLAGKLPFAAPNLPAMMEQHFRAPVPALSTRGAIADRARFDPVLQRALAKDPTARFPSAKALVDELRAAAGGKRIARAPAGRRALVPAAIGAGVLGVSILGVVAVRGTTTGDAAAATSRVAIASQPAGATVVLDGEIVGATPRTLDVARDRTHVLELRKPGYLPIRTQLDPAGGPLALALAPVSGFAGVWQLPDGRIRRFARTGERVDVYARDAVTGSDGASHTYEFGSAERGVAFTGTETVPDERSSDPSCRIAHGVEYRYEPGPQETLTVALERVGVAMTDGHCVVTTRAPGAPIPLRRVDRVDLGEVRYSEAPIGIPKPPPRKRPNPVQKAPPPNSPPVPNDTMDNRLDTNAQQQNRGEIVPQPTAQPPVPETQAPQDLPQPQQQAPSQAPRKQ